MSWYTNLSGLRTIRIASASPYTARYSLFVHQFCAKIWMMAARKSHEVGDQVCTSELTLKSGALTYT